STATAGHVGRGSGQPCPGGGQRLAISWCLFSLRVDYRQYAPRAVRRATPAYDMGVRGMPMMSMKMDAGPSAPVRSPSNTWTLNVSRSPSRRGLRNTTTASRSAEPSLLSADTVALGGSLAKLPLASVHSSSTTVVGTCPALLTGRSAKTMECGVTPVSVSV